MRREDLIDIRIEVEPGSGTLIGEVCKAAQILADEHDLPVHFEFTTRSLSQDLTALRRILS